VITAKSIKALKNVHTRKYEGEKSEKINEGANYNRPLLLVRVCIWIPSESSESSSSSRKTAVIAAILLPATMALA
jgi:hypothetical protein